MCTLHAGLYRSNSGVKVADLCVFSEMRMFQLVLNLRLGNLLVSLCREMRKEKRLNLQP